MTQGALGSIANLFPERGRLASGGLVAFTVLYVALHYGGSSRAWARASARLPWPAEVSAVFGRRVLGFLLLGLVPLAALPFLPGRAADYGLDLPGLRDLAWIGAGAVPVFGAVFLVSGRPDPVHPEARPPRWTTGLLVANGASWALYLLGYELAVRGWLFLPLVRAFGAGPAIAVDLAIYVLIHLPKEQRETLASLPFGLFVCASVLDTGGIWAAFALHVLAVTSNDTLRATRPAREPA